MLTKRILALIALFCLLPGIFALATEVECDSVYCFSGEEFGQALTGVCIIGLPDADTGTVLLGSRVVKNGDILTAAQLSQLTFQPLRTETDRTAQVSYLPIYDNAVAASASMTISSVGFSSSAAARRNQEFSLAS